MLKSVLDIKGLTILKREEKLRVKAGSCIDDAWDYGTRMNETVGADAYEATDWFYTNFCE